MTEKPGVNISVSSSREYKSVLVPGWRRCLLNHLQSNLLFVSRPFFSGVGFLECFFAHLPCRGWELGAAMPICSYPVLPPCLGKTEYQRGSAPSAGGRAASGSVLSLVLPLKSLWLCSGIFRPFFLHGPGSGLVNASLPPAPSACMLTGRGTRQLTKQPSS